MSISKFKSLILFKVEVDAARLLKEGLKIEIKV
jgi:hypothetical protein